MKKAWRYLVTAIVALTLILGSMAMAPAAHSDAYIRLKSGDFVPAQAQLAQQASQKYYIVQFAGPIEQSWKDVVSAEGAEVLDYMPDFAFKVRMNPSIAKRVQKLSVVSEVIPFRPEFKLGADLKRDGETNLYRIRVERGSDFGAVRSLIARTGTEILSYKDGFTAKEELASREGLLPGDGDGFVIVATDGSSIAALAALDDVASISNYYFNETHSKESGPAGNDTARDIIGATVANSRGYDGSSQIAAVSDTGLGGGTTATAHPDIPSSRIVAIYNWPGTTNTCFQTITNDGSIDVDSGHGTHTSGSVLSGGEPGGQGRGVAPAASLVFQSTENWATITALCQILGGWPANGYFLTGIPDDLKTMYQQAYNAGARIHSNSWGSAVAGDYTVDSANTDSFVWTNRDMVITFSAGNEGIDANANGVVDNDSIGSPATAKNVITVGASENARADNWPCDTSLTYTSQDAYQAGQTCNSMGGVNYLGTWGERYGDSFTAEPLFSDVTAGNAQQMASWSSRGPVDDTRIKPDVVAPGTWILSTASGLYQEGYGDPVNPQTGTYQWDGWGMPYNAEYKYMGGTSMSNPVAAGGVTVVRDYYNKAYAVNASAALVKATVINSAVDLVDENNDGANDNDFPIPNVHEGWGRINLDGATDGTIQFVDEGPGLATGGSQSFTVNSTGGPLKVTLVWSDYPSTDTASVNLVNDLDLTVTGPSGTFRGNVFSGGWSATGGSADRRNNVENVYVQNPTAGTYTVTVTGFNIPNGPQKFALVVDGGSLDTGPTLTPTYTPTITLTPTITPTATSTNTPPPGGSAVIYVSSTTNGNAGGVAFNDEDIVAYDTGTGTWSMYFDGSDVGVTGDVDAFALMPDGSILLSFDAPSSVDDSDIVRFTPTALGSNTAGTFSSYLTGSSIGLTTNDEDIDAIDFAPDGRLVVSTIGNFSVTGASGADEDLIALNSGGSGWTLYFDGSDVGLTSSSEDVNGLWIDPANNQLYLSTLGSFSVTGLSGDGSDIFICTPGSLGSTTACTFSAYWDGSSNGFSGEITDGVAIVK